MANCNHDKAGICKSCRQTIKEGGTVAVHAKPVGSQPPPAKPGPPVPPPNPKAATRK